jgi:hypothetical protein
MEKPSIFIGSSSEGLSIAQAVKCWFDRYADADVWNENVFKLNQSFLESLLDAANLYDFAILVLTPDDVLVSRDVTSSVARDNVIFEHGLFLGRLGWKRTFIICEETVKVLSDLSGISIAKFRKRDDGNLVSSVGTTCYKIKEAMENSFKHAELSYLPSTSIAIGYYENFLSKISASIRDNNFKIKDSSGKMVDDINYDSLKATLTIIIPDDLSYVEPARLGRIVKRWPQVIVHTEFRDFPFYVRGEFKEGNVLELFDIPTTLLASRKAIELVFSKSYLGLDVDEKKLERREIRNFRIAIDYLLRKNFGDDYTEFIKLGDSSFLDK